MIIGKLHHCTPADGMSILTVVKDLTKEYDFPIIYNLDFGHHHETITFPIGMKARIDTTKNVIEFVESAVV